MLGILIAALMGIFTGIFTGLMPGIHVNLVSAFVVASLPFFLKFSSAFNICVFIISMAITHTFLDTIPSIFLGAPDSDKILSVLPGHRMLLEGKGQEAVMLSIAGAIGGLVIGILFAPLLIFITPKFYLVMKDYIACLLILAVLMILILEKNSRKWAILIFLLSGAVGLLAMEIKALNESLFPLLSGLFGVSTLFISMNMQTKIREQNEAEDIEVESKPIIISAIGGWFASFMPGLGTSQVAIIISAFVKLTEKAFLVLVGGLGTVNMALSLVTFYSIDKARNGAIVAVSKIIEGVGLNEIAALAGVCLISSGIAVILTLKIAKQFAKHISKVNYRKLCLVVISIIFVLVMVISGWVGLIVLIVTSAIGILANLKGISKSHMMGYIYG
ncbi:tripartite tricarboxylate transporter permease [archaeon]|nr:tripartite tricarboxylate transporter permease [archaeon]